MHQSAHGHHQNKRDQIHRDGSQEERGFQECRDGVTHIQRPWDLLVLHEPPKPQDGGRGRERADSERVEEVGRETQGRESRHPRRRNAS